MRDFLNGRKPLLITAEAFKKISHNNPSDIKHFFDTYFLYFHTNEWNKICGVEIGDTQYSIILRTYWHNWTVTDKSLKDLNNEDYPDEIYFCGTTLDSLYKANKIIGDDMILCPTELIKN